VPAAAEAAVNANETKTTTVYSSRRTTING